MNIVEAKIIIKYFEQYLEKLEEARNNNTLGDFSLLPHKVSEILIACDVEIEYLSSIIETSEDEKIIKEAKINLMSIKNRKEGLLYIFDNSIL